MQDSEFRNIRAEQKLNTFHYHAAGLVEAQDRIREHLTDLDKCYGIDWEKTAEILPELWVEIYDHLLYHMKELRKPIFRASSASEANPLRTGPIPPVSWSIVEDEHAR